MNGYREAKRISQFIFPNTYRICTGEFLREQLPLHNTRYEPCSFESYEFVRIDSVSTRDVWLTGFLKDPGETKETFDLILPIRFKYDVVKFGSKTHEATQEDLAQIDLLMDELEINTAEHLLLFGHDLYKRTMKFITILQDFPMKMTRDSSGNKYNPDRKIPPRTLK
jgi:hypothetical protein